VERNLVEKAGGTGWLVAKRCLWHWLKVPGRRRFIVVVGGSSIYRSSQMFAGENRTANGYNRWATGAEKKLLMGGYQTGHTGKKFRAICNLEKNFKI